jgi:tetratricopeptide (TPR) repeat protein
LRYRLAQYSGLRLSGQVSSEQFKGEDHGVTGNKLNVETILEGAVRKEGKRLGVTAKLTKVPDGFILWSKNFDRDLYDVFDMQLEIVRSVTTALNPGSAQTPAPAGTMEIRNIDAYNAYLQGRYLLRVDDVESLRKAVICFEQAIQLEPNSGRAWAGLGAARFRLTAIVGGPEQDVQTAREAIERAVALNPGLAEAQASLASLKLTHDLDWTGADASVRRALALEPWNSQVIGMAGTLAARTGRLDEALAFFRQTIEIDPLNARAYMNFGTALYYRGRLQAARRALNIVLDLAPQISNGHGLLGKIYLALEQPKAALAEVSKEKDPIQHSLGLALAYHALGREAQSDANLAELIRNFQAVAAYQVAEAYAFRRQTNEAFDWLNRAYTERDPGITAVKVDPLLNDLRRDQRYPVLLKKLRLAL